MNFGDFVWYDKEGWIFIGMDEDGAYSLCRPIWEHPFKVMEYTQVFCEDFDSFLKENGIDGKTK